MSKRERRLGRGLSGLIGDAGVVSISPPPTSATPAPTTVQSKQTTNDTPHPDHPDHPGLRRVPVADLAPSPFQPRRHFDEGALRSLADSIAGAGVMQPILVRRAGKGGAAPWEIVAGERRWRAAQIAGLPAIPAIVVELDDRAAAEWSLVENLQREDLNPIERARAFRRLADEFNETHGEIAATVGVDRATVANLIRLTELEESAQSLLASGRLSVGHGKALLAAPPGEARAALARKASEAGWSVRLLEQRARALAAIAAAGKGGAAPAAATDSDFLSRRDAAVADTNKRLSELLGTKAEIRMSGASKSRGRVILHFYDLDQLDGLMQRLGVRQG